MDDNDLRELADALDASQVDEVPQSRLTQLNPCFWLTANRAACLRFAASFLRAAAEPIPDDEWLANPVSIDHDQIVEAKTDHRLGAIQRIDRFLENPEAILRRKRGAYRNDRIALIGCAFIGFFILFLIVSGIGFWWAIFTGKR